MINLRVRTSYNFGKVFGPINELADISKVIVMTDYNTFGYHALSHFKKDDNKIIYGIELNIVKDLESKSSNSIFDKLVLLATNFEGVKLIYKLTTLSYMNKGWFNRVAVDSINDLCNVVAISTDINAYKYYLKNRIIKCPLYFGLANTFNYLEINELNSIDKNKIVAISDNLYFRKEDMLLYEILATNASIDSSNSNLETRYKDRYLLTEEEWIEKTKYFLEPEYQKIAINNTQIIADMVEDVKFEPATLPDVDRSKSLLELCQEGAKDRGIDLEKEPYKSRLAEELDVIYSKSLFTNYFYIVMNLVKWAKERMLVGPGRGSGGGSLVCYLLKITDFDPIPYGLWFSRFLDKNRSDYPDIDIDFESFSPIMMRPNRDDCITYLEDTYGIENTGRVGRLLNIKGKSLYRYLTPFFKIEDYVNSFTDGVEGTGTANIERVREGKYKELTRKISEEIEDEDFSKVYRLYGNPISSGIHPSGVIVANKNLLNYQSVSFINSNKASSRSEERQLMIDVQDTDSMGLLKIDCLSLETLTTIHNCLIAIGKNRDWLLSLDYEDPKVYDSIFKDANTVGVFQFEGKELQEVCRTIGVKKFEDITACTSIARPASMKAGNVLKYKNGNMDNIKFDKLRKILEVTRGVIIYQEQLMAICKECFHCSIEMVNKARKMISKVRGDAAMRALGEELKVTGREHGVSEEDLEESWQVISKCGSYLFNKAHATAYSYITYWTAYLKTYYPFEFLVSILNTTYDIVKSSAIILYLLDNNHKVVLFDKNKSMLEWTYNKEEDVIIGPLTVLKGISVNKGREIIERREKQKEIKPGTLKILESGITKFNFLFNFKKFWSIIEDRWTEYFNNKPIKIIEPNIEATLVFYLIEKKEKVSSKGNAYISLRVYTGYEFTNLIFLDNEVDSKNFKVEKYYIGNIQGLFLKKVKELDINLIIGE